MLLDYSLLAYCAQVRAQHATLCGNDVNHIYEIAAA